MEQDIWERKYHLALERMERDERDFRTLEEGLRRLVLRLVALARGQSVEADRLLDRLGDGLREAVSPETLDPLLDALGEAVTSLDANGSPDHVTGSAGEARDPAFATATAIAVDALRQVLQRIVLMPTMAMSADALREALSRAHDPVAIAAAAQALADLVNRQREILRADIGTLQDLLAGVSGRLGDMTRYLAADLGGVVAGEEQSRDFDASVREEMRLLGEQTQGAADLASLQAQVNARLEIIDRQFRDHREREEVRLATYRDRAERMRDRVEELEAQATSLRDSLRTQHALALTDPLTKLPNRLAYEQHMVTVEASVRDGGAISCIGAFDIDHFKTINDSYGHAAGDAVLKIVGQALKRSVPEGAFVARYGGEEFVVVFMGLRLDAAVEAAGSLCATVERLAFHANTRPVTVTMSGGVTRFTATDTPAIAFDRADQALYTAKRAGRNRCAAL